MENGDGLFRDMQAQDRDQERTLYSLGRGHVLEKKDKTTPYKLELQNQHIHKWLDRKRHSLPPSLSRAHGTAGQNSFSFSSLLPCVWGSLSNYQAGKKHAQHQNPSEQLLRATKSWTNSPEANKQSYCLSFIKGPSGKRVGWSSLYGNHRDSPSPSFQSSPPHTATPDTW